MSESVANALAFYGDPNTRETERFVRQFDKFFDCLNVRNLEEHRKRRKPNLKPYTDPEDERLTVSIMYSCLTCFIKYTYYSCADTAMCLYF